MKTFYLITPYNLIDIMLYSYQKVTFVKLDSITKKDDKIIKIAGYTKKGFISYESNRFYYISETKKGICKEASKFFPYYADVIEDLPSSCGRLDPKVYKRCQLRTQKPNGYLLFYCKDSDKHLKIALNSHFYESLHLNKKDLKAGETYQVLTYNPNTFHKVKYNGKIQDKSNTQNEVHYFTNGSNSFLVTKEELTERVIKNT